MFFHSSNVLIGFDNNAFDGKVDDFTFLNLIQSISFNSKIESQREKFIGSDVSLRDQYLRPEIDFTISYIQRVDFFNEFLFGFNIYTKDSNKFSIYKKYEQGFLNENAFVILNSDNGDLISKVLTNQTFDKNFKAISFGKVFLRNYSIQYSVGKLPIVEASFSAFNTSTSSIESRLLEHEGDSNALFYGFENWNGEFYKTNFLKVKEAADSLNQNQNESIVYQMKNFSLSSNYADDDLKLPNLNFNTLLDGIIQTLSLNINLNNAKYDFFEKPFFDYKSLYPIKGNLEISGISSALVDGDLNDVFSKTKLFDMVLSLGKDEINKDYYEILIEDLSIENFTYSIDVNGRLIYSISCYFEISERGGLSIKQIRKNNTSPISSDSGFLISNDGEEISTNPQFTPKALPKITKNLDSCLVVKQSSNRCLCLTAVDEENNSLCYSWYCNGNLICNYGQNYLCFPHNQSINGYYNVVVANCINDRVKSTISLVVAECKPVLIQNLNEENYCIFSNTKIDLKGRALANCPSQITYDWYKKRDINPNYKAGFIATQYDGFFGCNIDWFKTAQKKPIIESISIRCAGTACVNQTFALRNLEPSLSNNTTHLNDQENLQIQYKNSKYYLLNHAQYFEINLPFSFSTSYYYASTEFKSGIKLYVDKELKIVAKNLRLVNPIKLYLYETDEFGVLSIKFIMSFVLQFLNATPSLEYVYYVGDETEYETTQRPIRKFANLNGKKLYKDSDLLDLSTNSLYLIDTNEDVNIYQNSPDKAWYLGTLFEGSYIADPKLTDWMLQTNTDGIISLNRIEKFVLYLNSEIALEGLRYNLVNNPSDNLSSLAVGDFIVSNFYYSRLFTDVIDFRRFKSFFIGGLYSFVYLSYLPNYSGFILTTDDAGMINFYNTEIQFNVLYPEIVSSESGIFAGGLAYQGTLLHNSTVFYFANDSGILSRAINYQWQDNNNYYETDQIGIVKIFNKQNLQNFNILDAYPNRFAYQGQLENGITVLYYLDGVNIAINIATQDQNNNYTTDEFGTINISAKVE